MENNGKKKSIQLPVIALGGLFWCIATPLHAQKHTNIVLVNLDDVGYGDFSCNGAYGYAHRTSTVWPHKECASHISWPASPSAAHHAPACSQDAIPTVSDSPAHPDRIQTTASIRMK